MRKHFCYIQINEKENYIYSSGMKFLHFYQAIENKPNNILILKGFPSMCNSEYNMNLGFYYIDKDNMSVFLQHDGEDVYYYGDFCWVDYKNENDLDKVGANELSEILYIAHKGKPLNSFKFKSLNNKYVYLAHDDHYFAKIYMEDTKEYKKVIEFRLIQELRGRRRFISSISDEVMDTLYDYFKKGAVIDFERSYSSGVRIYQIGENLGGDYIHDTLDRQREIRFSGINIEYNPRTKKWNIH